MKRHFVRVMGVSMAFGAAARAQVGDGKPLQLASREPAFYAIVGSHIERAEARNVVALRQRVVLRLHDATIAEALKAIEAQTALRFAFKPSILPSGAVVSLDASDITVAAALTQILEDADVDVEIAPYGLASIVTRQTHAAPDTTTGTLTGRVTDSKTHLGIPYVTVSVEGTTRTSTANDSGDYRLTRVPSGPRIITARRVGYVATRQPVTIASGAVTTLNFALTQSANPLDQVVVTGTLVPASMKSVPTPVTIVTDSEIANEQPRTINQFFRQAVPTAVGFDEFSQPYATYLSVRGATELLQGGTRIKILVDGVEVATNASNPVDPESIDRVEVIRGPEAAAIYGSGAIDGVIEIFTKHGDQTNGHPAVDLQVAGADVQTPYAGFRGVLRQNYTGDVRGGTDDASYMIGGGYTQTNNYLPFGQNSAQSTPSVYSGVHYFRGFTTLDVSARYHIVNAPAVFNPEYTRTGPPGAGNSTPTYDYVANGNTTVGASLIVQPLPSWRNVVTIGYDEFNSNITQHRPHLTSPSDTELAYSYTNYNKISVRAYESLTEHMGPAVTTTLTVGADYWTASEVGTASFGVLNTQGPIQTDPNQPFTTSRVNLFNTGVFAQAQIDVLEALFITGGLRAEWNSGFGDSIGVPLSPRIGIAYSHSLGGSSSIKLRSSWGSAILPPTPGEKIYTRVGNTVNLANAHLFPERQHGGDGGFDLMFGQVGSFSATFYDQTAVNSLQQVKLPVDTPTTYQTQNVGTVKNTGIELEARANIDRLTLRVMYGFSRSRVDQLEPGYVGDYHVGDQALDVPRHTAGGSAAMQLTPRTNIAAGFTYVGPWTDYDYIRLNNCGATFSAPQCPQAFLDAINAGVFTQRPFFIQYRGLVKGNLTVTQKLNSWASAFVAIDNIGDNQGYEASNDQPRVGRISTFGLRLHY
ncbi:MAG TPA: TonB-dependent receptor [Gemmatimonadaceae bacterium]|nr:TonB-dependent receptor [Gemmatimonadaceae bacterium]